MFLIVLLESNTPLTNPTKKEALISFNTQKNLFIQQPPKLRISDWISYFLNMYIIYPFGHIVNSYLNICDIIVHNIQTNGGVIMYYLQRLRDLREDMDLHQKDIAKLLKTTQPQYSRYETGEREIPIRHIVTLADFYGVSTDYILGRTNQKHY